MHLTLNARILYFIQIFVHNFTWNLGSFPVSPLPNLQWKRLPPTIDKNLIFILIYVISQAKKSQINSCNRNDCVITLKKVITHSNYSYRKLWRSSLLSLGDNLLWRDTEKDPNSFPDKTSTFIFLIFSTQNFRCFLQGSDESWQFFWSYLSSN